MKIFDNDQSISICLQNATPFVRLAVEDLRMDFLRVSYLTELPALVEEEGDFCLIIKENPCKGDPLSDESFSLNCDGKRVTLSANTYLGTLWGIYTFSEKILGVHPCYLFNDLQIEKSESLEIAPFSIREQPQKAGFRGIFINDEDLLTGWKSGGIRPIDYPWYQTTVAESVMDKVVETALRLKINLIIPASFLDIDNPPEKALADCVAKRGLFLSQHHIEPLGVSHFTFENYCKRRGKAGEYSFIHNPEILIEAWKCYAEKWAQYDNLVWQVGLRGKADRPVWEEETPTQTALKTYADYINRAVETQKQIACQATGGKAKYFSTTLWMEGSLLMEKGLLSFGEDTIVVFADNGPNQMFGREYDSVPRLPHQKYGIYYHLQYHDIGPHLVPQTGLDKLCYNLKKAKEKGDDSYFILNVSNVREFDFELRAYAELLWDMDAFSAEGFLDDYANLFGVEKERAKAFVRAYFENLPTIDKEYLRYVHAKYFNYNYEEISPAGVKNFILKDELVAVKGSEVLWFFKEELPHSLYEKMHLALKKSLPIYEEFAVELAVWSVDLPARLQQHIQCKWWLYAQTLCAFYRWFICVYEGKLAYDEKDFSTAQKKIHAACESLENYLSIRKCAEYGTFENWFRGETKVNTKKRLNDTKEILKFLKNY